MISVIVPIYNVEEYLDECVKSILAQIYVDFELILVDDGSIDRSGAMCDEYAEIDCRIKVIHKTNGGLSDARNTGIVAASGDYITYIDSDDIVSKWHLELLHQLIVEQDADISITRMQIFYNNSKPDTYLPKGEKYVFSGDEALEHMLYQKLFDSSACSVLLRAHIAKCGDNLFPVGKYHEDDFTTYKYYGMAKKVVISTITTYFYRQRSGSIMHTWGKANFDELEAADNIVSVCEERYPKLTRAAKSKKFSNYCQALLCLCGQKENNHHLYKRIVNYIETEKWNILLDKNCRVKNRIAAAMCCFGVPFFVFLGAIRNKKAELVNW